jgi:hypothetical protein
MLVTMPLGALWGMRRARCPRRPRQPIDPGGYPLHAPILLAATSGMRRGEVLLPSRCGPVSTQGRRQGPRPCQHLHHLDTYSHAIPAMQESAAATVARLVFGS